MDNNTPLDIPEIRRLVAGFLPRADHCRCILVCRAWYDTFMPLVWEKVTTGCRFGPGHRMVYCRRQFIKVLELSKGRPKDFSFQCPNLETLIIDMNDNVRKGFRLNWETEHADTDDEDNASADDDDYWRLPKGADCCALLEKNPTLTGLRISCVGITFMDTTWYKVSTLPNLKHLCIDYSIVNRRKRVPFWSTVANLESLEISRSRVTLMGIWDMTFPLLRRLRLTENECMEEYDCVELARRSPQLRELEIDLFWCDLTEMAVNGLVPHLERLVVESGYGSQDKDLAVILDHMQPAVGLALSRSRFGPLAFSSLRRHFGTLRELDLRNCNGVTSSMLQEILSSCPRLEELHGDEIMLKDIVQGASWICQSIKKLRLGIVADKDDKDLLAAFQLLLPTLPAVCSELDIYFQKGQMDQWRSGLKRRTVVTTTCQ